MCSHRDNEEGGRLPLPLLLTLPLSLLLLLGLRFIIDSCSSSQCTDSLSQRLAGGAANRLASERTASACVTASAGHNPSSPQSAHTHTHEHARAIHTHHTSPPTLHSSPFYHPSIPPSTIDSCSCTRSLSLSLAHTQPQASPKYRHIYSCS